MVSLNNISVEFSARPLFRDLSFVINSNDRIALVGKNGAGKSTLLKILAGQQSPDSGSITVPSGLTIGYLPQQMNPADDTTVMEEVRKAFSEFGKRSEELDAATTELGSRDDYDSEEYASLLERIDYLSNLMAIDSPEHIDAEAERTLIGLGFSRDDFNRPTSEFSGGWRMRIELARLLLKRPDILLLDEPTNHLDIESIQWLEQFLAKKGCAVLLVSHDRAFLDNVTNRTIEINCGRIYDYKVKYSDFAVLRKERLEQQMRAYENQQKQIADIKDFIERFRYKATKAVQVQSRIKQLEKIVPIEVDEVDRSSLHLKFPPAPRSGDFPLILENVGKSYGDHQVFDHAEFSIRRGEKVAFVGKNGEGKSTLVKCIMGEIPFTGNLKIGHNVSIGYFAQNQAQLLDPTLTVYETIDNVAVGEIRTRIRDLLGAFMFGQEDVDKRVGVLSGGEKTRLAMIKLLLQPVNLLILDEPTNHLDMRTKDILKDAINAFDGTVIVVSHDREFLDGLVGKVYEFGGGRVRENIGGIYEFLHKKRIASLSELEKRPVDICSDSLKKVAPNETAGNFPADNASKSSSAYNREREKLRRKAEKRVKSEEDKIALIEAEITAIEERLSAGEHSPEVLQEYEAAKKRLDVAMAYWEEASDELNNFDC